MSHLLVTLNTETSSKARKRWQNMGHCRKKKEGNDRTQAEIAKSGTSFTCLLDS